MTTADQAWQALADWQPQKLTDLVSADPEARLQALVRTVADIRAAMAAQPGARALVIVGASHKGYFEAYLNMMHDIRLVDAEAVLR